MMRQISVCTLFILVFGYGCSQASEGNNSSTMGGEATQVEDDCHNRAPYNIGITANNQYFTEENPSQYVSLDVLIKSIQSMVEDDDCPTIRINADKDARWDYVYSVIRAAENNGWKYVFAGK